MLSLWLRNWRRCKWILGNWVLNLWTLRGYNPDGRFLNLKKKKNTYNFYLVVEVPDHIYVFYAYQLYFADKDIYMIRYFYHKIEIVRVFLSLIASISVSAILVARNIITLCCINTRTLYHGPSTTDVPHTCALVARAKVKWHHTHISTGCSDVTMLRLFFSYSIYPQPKTYTCQHNFLISWKILNAQGWLCTMECVNFVVDP